MVELHKHSISEKYEEKKGTKMSTKNIWNILIPMFNWKKRGSGICYVLD